MDTELMEILADDAYVNELLQMDSIEKVQESLESRNVDISLEELRQVAALLKCDSGEELDDDALVNVTGGIIAENTVSFVFPAFKRQAGLNILSDSWIAGSRMF